MPHICIYYYLMRGYTTLIITKKEILYTLKCFISLMLQK